MFWPPSAQKTSWSCYIGRRKKELLCFKIKEQQLCLCECKVPQSPSGLLMDKGILRVGNVKTSGWELLSFAMTEDLLYMPIGRALRGKKNGTSVAQEPLGLGDG